MRQRLARLVKMSTGYGLVQWAGPAFSLVFTPILTRILNPSDYGIADYVMTVASALGTLAMFAVPQALLAHFNDRPQDEAWQRQVTGSALTLIGVLALPVTLGLVLLAAPIAQATLHDPAYTPLFQWLGATALFGMSNAVLVMASQAALRVRWGMVFSLTTLLATILGNIVYIIVLRLGVLGLVLVPVTANLAQALVALWITRPLIGRPAFPVMGRLFRSGAILLPAMLSAWALQVVDRLFLVNYVTTTELGYYAIANKIAGLLYVLMGPVYSAWTPLALAMQHEERAPARYAIMARYLIGTVLAAALFLGLFATEILIVLTRAPYLPAAPYVGFLAYTHVLGAVGTILVTGALAGKQLKEATSAVMAGAVANLFLNALWIPQYGVWGATLATVAGVAIPQIVLYPIVQRRYPIPYATGQILAAMALQLALLVAGAMLPPLPFLLRMVVKLGLFALLPLSFVLLGLVTPFELRQAWLLVRQQVAMRLRAFGG